MENCCEANVNIHTAGDSVLHGSRKGKLKSHVLNLAGYKGIDTITDFDIYPTTVKGLQKELLSADDYFRYGKFNVCM